MIAFLSENIGSILVGAVLALIVFLIIRGMVKDRKNGKSGCSEGCPDCSACGGRSCARTHDAK